ncbi:PREDICTED: GDSL esterase/lipase At4g01130-like isoform X1 [Ipomoea nil]|uniref:GDSL esterase/lipase At4g01130-like isoform X1 n=1 Tax=Ipomoea nil TaxID=35883 RepID=UPI000900FD6C|nr:PREDICTED: GDSL esterase/lipase At4g01130-like isoform X1 [Ipomoea nil]
MKEAMSNKVWGLYMCVFLAVLTATAVPAGCVANCSFPAIFNFGDSNTDTGGFWAAFPAQRPPHGMTFFKKPVGRATDGRVIVDFLAQGLGLAFLSPYLKSIGSDYRNGVNFATLASTVRLPHSSLFDTGVSPFSLAIQFNQFKQFKVMVDEQEQEQHHSYNHGNTKLPPKNIFGKALYTFYIGQNDFTGNLASLGINGVKQFLPEVVGQIASTIKDIYTLGGRTFFILNLAPIGCYPAFLVELPHNNSDIDQFGCMKSYNNAVVDYNNMLKDALRQTRQDLKDANVVYVDTHSILLELFQHPTSHGLKYGTKACCGYGGGDYNFNKEVFCGNTKVVNGQTVSAGACEDPYNYVSWDGIHATDAANKLTAKAIFNGSYFDPPFPLHHFCHIHPIG